MRVRTEMEMSRSVIEAALGKRPEHLRYPVGDRTSAGPREFRIAAELGFKTAVTTRPGVLFPEHAAHLTALPRISLNGEYQQLRYVGAAVGSHRREGRAAVGTRLARDPVDARLTMLDCRARWTAAHPAHQRHRRQHPAQPCDHIVERPTDAVLADRSAICANAIASSAHTIDQHQQRDGADEFAGADRHESSHTSLRAIASGQVRIATIWIARRVLRNDAVDGGYMVRALATMTWIRITPPSRDPAVALCRRRA